MTKTLRLGVKGMTCNSCEVLIERKLRQVPGVEKVKASLGNEETTVKCADEVQLDDLQNVVSDKGYSFFLKEEDIAGKRVFFNTNGKKWYEIGAALMIIIGIYFVLKQLELLPKNFGVSDTMSYGFVFVLGLIAATSTCLAVAGGLLLAVVGRYQEKYPHLTGAQKFKPHIYFNVGRMVSYTLLGGVIGIVGSMLTLSATVTGTITIVASVLMIIIGLQLLQVFPWLNKIRLKMPKFIAHRVYKASEQDAPSRTGSFFFGAATFFLPCGFTQALQLYVLGRGDFTVGALTMLAFSLGTLPALAGIGAFSSFAKGNTQKYFLTFSAVLVIVLGIFNIPSGLTLVGTARTSVALDAPLEPATNVVDGKQVITLAVKGLDYYPDQFTLTQGIPVEWRIDGSQAQGCAQIITIPSLGITERLPRDQIKTITFTPQQAGQIRFTCSMGMAGPGTFNVVPQA